MSNQDVDKALEVLDELDVMNMEANEALTLIEQGGQDPLVHSLLIRRVRYTLECHANVSQHLRNTFEQELEQPREKNTDCNEKK